MYKQAIVVRNRNEYLGGLCDEIFSILISKENSLEPKIIVRGIHLSSESLIKLGAMVVKKNAEVATLVDENAKLKRQIAQLKRQASPDSNSSTRLFSSQSGQPAAPPLLEDGKEEQQPQP